MNYSINRSTDHSINHSINHSNECLICEQPDHHLGSNSSLTSLNPLSSNSKYLPHHPNRLHPPVNSSPSPFAAPFCSLPDYEPLHNIASGDLHALCFSTSDLQNQKISLDLLLKTAPSPQCLATVEVEGICRRIDVSESFDRYKETIMETSSSEHGTLKLNFMVVSKFEYYLLMQMSKMRELQLQYLLHQFDLVNRDAAKLQASFLKLQSQVLKQNLPPSRVGEFLEEAYSDDENRSSQNGILLNQLSPKSTNVIEVPLNTVAPCADNSLDCDSLASVPVLNLKRSPRILNTKFSLVQRYGALNSPKTSPCSSEKPVNIYGQVENGELNAFITTDETDDSSSAKTSKGYKEIFTHLKGAQERSPQNICQSAWQFRLDATKKHFALAKELESRLSKEYQEKLEQVTNKLVKRHSKEINDLRNESSRETRYLKEHVARLEMQNKKSLSVVKKYSSMANCAQQSNSSDSVFEGSEMSKNSLAGNAKSLEIFEKEAVFKQCEINEIESRLIQLGEERDEIAFENGKLADKHQLLLMRGERLNANVYVLISKQEGLQKSVDNLSAIYKEKESHVQELVNKQISLQADNARLEESLKRSHQRASHMAALVELEKQLSEGKLIALVCLLQDYIADIWEGIREFMAGGIALPSFIDGYELVTFKADEGKFSSLFVENYGRHLSLGLDFVAHAGKSDSTRDVRVEEQKSYFQQNETGFCDYKQESNTGDTATPNSDEISNVASLVLKENMELYERCKIQAEKSFSGMLKSSRPLTHDTNTDGSLNKGKYRAYTSMVQVESDFDELVSKLGVTLENVKFILNVCRGLDEAKTHKMVSMQKKHEAEVEEAIKMGKRMSEAVRAKYQYLQRNCDYFRHENDFFINLHERDKNQSRNKVMVDIKYLKERYGRAN